ncbi:MAG: hypothetical protein OXG69_12805 [bacterium]|nr:hypothetical protein [bacterium]
MRVPRCPSSPRRDVHHVPPGESRLAILELLRDASGAFQCDDLRREWARLFGWARVGTNTRDAFDEAIGRLIAIRRIERRGDTVHLVG